MITYTKGNRYGSPQYYIVWVEGLNWKNGEKLSRVNPLNGEREYSSLIKEAIHFHPSAVKHVRGFLKRNNVSATFVNKSYLPKGAKYMNEEHAKRYFKYL